MRYQSEPDMFMHVNIKSGLLKLRKQFVATKLAISNIPFNNISVVKSRIKKQ